MASAWRQYHKSAAIAQRQRRAGAIGATVSTIDEAESLAEGGIEELLLAHCFMQPDKLTRIARLCRSAAPIVCCDHYAQAEALCLPVGGRVLSVAY